ncbi:MAG TPA: hypothetical protein VFU53_11830 [Burkholderiales bacterium]|nr:hypothetical protein [Burkholderiales bacterium]
MLFGQNLIHDARVRSIIAQQGAVESAVLAFQDRYRALPGDYAGASIQIACAPSPCLNGDGNGWIDPVNANALREDILAWTHLAAAGLLENRFSMPSAGVLTPSDENTPSNALGAYMHLASDDTWGASLNNVRRINIKTGNMVPVEILAHVDSKIDDGRPGSGRFQFSTYAAIGAAPAAGGSTDACTDADTPDAVWQVQSGQSNCGAATLLR